MKKDFYDNLSIFFRNLICQNQEYMEEQKDINIYKPIFIEENITLKYIQNLRKLSFKSRKIKIIDNQVDIYTKLPS